MFVNHNRNPSCISWILYDYNKTKEISILAIPLYFGFKREILISNDDGQKYVRYKTPCGRVMSNIHETFNYLSVTKTRLKLTSSISIVG